MSRGANNRCLRAYAERIISARVEGQARSHRPLFLPSLYAGQMFIRSGGRSCRGYGSTFLTVSSIREELRSSFFAFSCNNRSPLSLGIDRTRLACSSRDRKPAQPPAIVVGKWVWRTPASCTPHHMCSMVPNASLPIILSSHSHFTPKIYTLVSFLFLTTSDPFLVTRQSVASFREIFEY